MRIFEPWSTSEADQKAIECAAQALTGASLTSIRYISPQSSTPSERRCYNGFDAVLKGVEFSSPRHMVVAMWQMDGVKEGLGFVVDPDVQFNEDEGLQALDVTQWAQWAALLGSPVISSALSWQVPDDEAPRCVWSYRLNFESGKSVTLALGDLAEDGDDLTYQPDNVVVIFDTTIAQGYRIFASCEPAWGTVIA